jgi:hypothetical protein
MNKTHVLLLVSNAWLGTGCFSGLATNESVCFSGLFNFLFGSIGGIFRFVAFKSPGDSIVVATLLAIVVKFDSRCYELQDTFYEGVIAFFTIIWCYLVDIALSFQLKHAQLRVAHLLPNGRLSIRLSDYYEYIATYVWINWWQNRKTEQKKFDNYYKNCVQLQLCAYAHMHIEQVTRQRNNIILAWSFVDS